MKKSDYAVRAAMIVVGILSFVATVYGGERPASAPLIDERLTGIEDKINKHTAEIDTLRREVATIEMALKCPCNRGGECICGEDCLCLNCPKHKKKKSTVVPSGLENQDDGIPFYGVSWKGTQPTNKGVELLFFTASWCPNCPAAETRLGSTKSEIYKIDCTDKNPIAERYGINGFPYLLRIVDGGFDVGRAGDAVHEKAARDWLSGGMTAGAGANTLRGKPSVPAVTSRVVNHDDGDASDDQIRQHLVDAHGYSWSQVSGMNRSQLKAAHDRSHGGPAAVARNYPVRRTYSQPTMRYTQPAYYQPRTYFRSSSGYCPNCR